MHRFFLAPESFEDDVIEVDDKNLLHQWMKVLRFGVGNTIILCDGNEMEYESMFDEISHKKALLKIVNVAKKFEHQPYNLQLYVSILNNQKRFELILEKCTELGVSEFHPLICARTQERHLNKWERLEHIIREASEQSGRTKLAKLHQPVSVSDAVMNIATGEPILIGSTIPAPFLNEWNMSAETMVHVFIGPEGDFSEEEMTLFETDAAQKFWLGNKILRTETAAIAACSLLLCR